MGLYQGRGSSFDAAGVAALMRPAVEAWFTGHIVIQDPNLLEATPYDPKTDTGGDATPTVLWDSGPGGALVQPIRAQTLGDFGGQAVGLVGVRIQAAVPDDIELRSGLQIKVVDGGNDTEAERHLYVIGSGVDSTLRWVTRITAMVVTA